MLCHSCKNDIPTSERVSFRESCSRCGRDAHVCLNCFFYDRSAYNECRETSADRVVDKEKANYCEYFQPANPSPSQAGGSAKPDPAAEAKRRLEALFKK